MRLMYAGAALEVLVVIIAVLSKGSLKAAILASHPGYDTARLHTSELARVTPLVVGGLVGVGLWLWMAWANRSGRSWARIVAAVLFGINTLDALSALVLVRGAVASQIIGAVVWLVGLAAIILIFNRESGPFYSQQAA
ncbi:MAG: hypothetical protein ACRDPO_23050 [Streptosporangiaceae bacterium]